MKHLFIINPVAGKGKALKLIPDIERVFKNHPEDYIIEITERPGHATEIVRSYVEKEIYRVYSMGGDGTLNEVLNGMAGSRSILGVIPCGSGNDFIKSIDNGRDIYEIIERTIQGKERLIDLAKVNGRYFANISSMGFDGEVVYNTSRFKKLPAVSGRMAYILGVFYSLIRCKNYHLNISIDGEHIETESLLTAIANGRYYGGGMMPAPEAVLDDGLLDVCLIKKVNRLKLLRFFPKFIKGTHGSIEEVSFYKGRRIEVKCNEDIFLNLDGEVSRVREAVFEVIPQGICIVMPRQLDDIRQS